MLSERPYMRDDYPREKTSPFTWVLAAIFGAFVMELVLFSQWFDASDQMVNGLALTIAGLKAGHVWTFATYWLLHSTNNLFHVAIVLGGFYTLSRGLEPQLGARRVIGVFAASLLLGGLVWAAVNWHSGGILLGGTAGIYGLLAFYAALQPNREFSFLLLFFFPVTVKPKHLAVGLFAFDLLIFAYFDVLGNPAPFAYASSAHLGGMMAGWICYRYFHRRLQTKFRAKAEQASSEWADSIETDAEPVLATHPVEPTNRAELRAELDRILDKINSHGFGALTADEKRRLDQAKNLLSRH